MNRTHFLPIILLACFTIGCGKPSQAHTGNKKSAMASPVARAESGWEDSDGDGIPNAEELHSFDDRANFRRWFTSIAEMQFYHFSDAWSQQKRDCAGLVRFTWRAALRRHDRIWFQGMGASTGA